MKGCSGDWAAGGGGLGPVLGCVDEPAKKGEPTSVIVAGTGSGLFGEGAATG